MAAIPAEPLPVARQERIDGPQQALQFFKRNIVGKLLTTPLGKTFTAKLGHFFRLIATKPEGKKKGFIEKASSPEEAMAMVENGEIGGEDIAGYQEFRAKNMPLFSDVLESPHLVLQDRARKHVFLFVKRYQRQGVEFFDAAMVTTGPKELGVLSFAPIGKIAPNWLAKLDLVWKAGSVVVGLSQTTPPTERVEQERTVDPIDKIPQSAESSSASSLTPEDQQRAAPPSAAPTASEPPILSSYTQAELNARKAAEEQAAAQRAARDKAADERAAADRARNDFTLSGSDRPADVAMARGQEDLLSEMKAPARPAGYGANNKLVSVERAEELRKKLRAKLNQLNAGVDPELLALGTELAVFHLEAGVRKFTDFAQTMINDLGEAARPYLRSWYEGGRYFPGVDTQGMTPSAELDAVPEATPVELDMFGDPIPTDNVAVELAVVNLPVDQLRLSNDVPQFKSGADSRNGVVEPLGGTFDPTGVAPIQVWKRLNGDLEVISGRHRLDLARRSNRTTIAAQIHNEADGFDVDKASILDAELNIRDGQGKVKDYVDYFTKTPISKAEAELRGLLARTLGQRAYSIAVDGAEELIAAHRANALSDEAATSIARAAPGNSRLQAVAIKAVLDGKSIVQAVNTLHAVRALASERADTAGDLFGLDDSAMREAERMATIASRQQRMLSERLAAVQGAAKRPELARKEGVDVKDAAALNAKITKIKNERDAWNRWSTDPALIAQIREKLHPG